MPLIIQYVLLRCNKTYILTKQKRMKIDKQTSQLKKVETREVT